MAQLHYPLMQLAASTCITVPYSLVKTQFLRDWFWVGLYRDGTILSWLQKPYRVHFIEPDDENMGFLMSALKFYNKLNKVNKFY